MMAERTHPTFKLSPLYHWLWVVPGMGLTGVLSCCPEILPYSSLGPVGTFLHSIAYDYPTLITAIFIGALGLHLLEGTVALVMCLRMNLSSQDTVLWTLQTYALGVGSLLPLRALYKRYNKSQ